MELPPTVTSADGQDASCPCNSGSTAQVPPYIGNDYYTVRLVTMVLVHSSIFSFPMIPCGMGSSVMVRMLPAVLSPTCRGSPRHSVKPPLRIFS